MANQTKQKQPTDYCPNCGCYHAIGGPCNSNQTEPDIDDDYGWNETDGRMCRSNGKEYYL